MKTGLVGFVSIYLSRRLINRDIINLRHRVNKHPRLIHRHHSTYQRQGADPKLVLRTRHFLNQNTNSKGKARVIHSKANARQQLRTVNNQQDFTMIQINHMI